MEQFEMLSERRMLRVSRRECNQSRVIAARHAITDGEER